MVDSFKRDVLYWIDQAAADAGRVFVDHAHDVLEQEVRAGNTPSSRYERYINGVINAPDSAATVPGEIKFNFQFWENVIPFCLDFAVRESPSDSGRYKKSWVALVDGVVWDAAQAVPRGAIVTITNDQPYHRKIEVGHTKFNMPDSRIVERMRQAVLKEFRGLLEAQNKMIELTGPVSGHAAEVPYELRGKFTRGRRVFSRKGLRKDTAKGQKMKYPALVMRAAEYKP